MKSFEYCVFIGRFQPFHRGHYELLKEAFNQAEKVLIVIGSYNLAPDIRNPFTAAQREEMVRAALTDEEKARVKFLYVRDYYYLPNMWVADVQGQVFEATGGCDDSKICNIGSVWDFPQWKFFKVPDNKNFKHATEIRDLYFTYDVQYKEHVHPNVATLLENFKKTDTFKQLKNNYDFIQEYHRAWEGAPFPPTFVTVDAVVIRSGHVLVVRRRGALGKGLIALPGGFLNRSETTQEGMLRELKEETGIKLPKEELEKAIAARKVFDHPDRSLRGRTITHAYLIDLKRGPLPQVKGEDDADKAWWMSLREVEANEDKFFEDHFHIINYLAGSPFMK